MLFKILYRKKHAVKKQKKLVKKTCMDVSVYSFEEIKFVLLRVSNSFAFI